MTKKSIFCICALTFSAFGQDKKLEFDVVSIKPNNTGDHRMSLNISPGRFSAKGATAKMLIMQAFDVKDFQITGGPSWLGSDRFDLEAKLSEGEEGAPGKLTLAEQKTRVERMQEMMRSLLADRFKLKFHEDAKEAPAYALVVGKSGPKMKPAEAGAEQGSMMRMGHGQLTANGTTMERLANQLSNMVGRPVVNKTGLEGPFDVELKYTPEPGQGAFGFHGAGSDSPPPVDANGPTIFTAVQEQLGLKLDGIKTPSKVIVIDGIEKPSEN